MRKLSEEEAKLKEEEERLREEEAKRLEEEDKKRREQVEAANKWKKEELVRQQELEREKEERGIKVFYSKLVLPNFVSFQPFLKKYPVDNAGFCTSRQCSIILCVIVFWGVIHWISLCYLDDPNSLLI